MSDISEKISGSISRYIFPLTVGVVGLILSVYGLITLSSQKTESDIIFTSGDQQSRGVSAVQGAAVNTLVIDVAGAVEKPGVYRLAEDSRVKDAIAAAGGLNEEADTDLVAKQFNQAMRVTDGMKLYIPQLGERERTNGKGFSTGNTNAGLQTSGQININSANVSELDTLSGIGKITAEKIINGRPYTAIDELLSKKIVSQKVFDQIKEQISTY